ncbi:cobyrinic acid a,c-diamide synthase [Acetobacter pasteurianus NBRC 3280]|uniref:Cobyrinic acid a,c-diamide synthase n=1 Tax=Acetobacter pasteurianus NBRC 3278 TaxID=1226660 RepID=A0A401X1M4_ACEPA|nr:cobyrinic acid a,c-diamide synthase [Acetobacter pasteurianus NBRC 3278]GCD68075.1 cobyrinic acid a,c-diamide synthase [Acetobacter pasteurianus NBRC 3280]
MLWKNLKSLSVVAQKGGTGKTTLAVNLAVLAALDGLRVALIDCDPQRSAAGWWQIRKEEWPALIEQPAGQLPSVMETLRAEGFNLAIVDTRPSVEAETLEAVQNSTVAIIPTRPTSMDISAVALTAQLVRSAQKPGCIVLNQCPPSIKQGEAPLTAETRTIANTLGLPVAPPALVNRIAYPYASNGGMAVREYEPGKAADQEMTALWSHIKKGYLSNG